MECFDRTRRRPGESGQTAVVVLILLSVFLLGVLGFATDYAQVWAHRQSAQAAADAACQAGAADLYLNYANSGSGLDFSWIGTAFTCTTSSTNAVCKYGAANGYSGSTVSATFPSSVAGVSLTGFGTFPYPFIKVTVTDSVPLTFSRLFQSSSTLSITASATCGASPVSVPIPMVVLNKTASGSFALSGNPTITIIGGPNRSIQVDSSSTTAFNAGGSSVVDLRLAGQAGTGADIGVFGKETQPGATNVKLGTSGKWVSPALPYGDPWATISLPSAPTTAGSVTSVGYGVNGCPDPSGCTEFAAGNYSGCTNSNGNLASGSKGCLVIPTKYNISFSNWTKTTAYTSGNAVRPSSGNAGNFVFQASTGTSGGAAPVWPQTTGSTVVDGTVTWTNVGNPTNSPNTAIFDPGLYYLDGTGLQLNSNSTVRPSTATGDGSNGTTFYFSAGGSGEVSVSANSGKSADCTSVSNPTSSSPSGSSNGCVVPYTVAGTTYLGTGSQALKCPTNGADNPSQINATVSGNILLGPCSGTYTVASTDGKSYRGFLFFQNRGNSGSANWGGGGQFLLAGFMYFHDTSYSSTYTLSGNSASGAFTLGNIVTDELTLGGSSGIDMILNPAASYSILRPTLLQ